jgi:hypothetical protein
VPADKAVFWKTDIFLPKGQTQVYSSENGSIVAGADDPELNVPLAQRRNPQIVAEMGCNLLKSLGWRKEQGFGFRCAGFGFCCARL